MPETSVIVRSYNEEKHLPDLFDALEEQQYRDFETVVVDSGSLDRSREIAKERASRVVRIQQHDFTFGYSLNEGIRQSGGAFLAIISAHAKPANPHWLARLIEPLRRHKTAMVYGRQRGVPQSKFGEALDFERTFGSLESVLTPPNFFANNANSAVRRDLWQEHPFDETLPGLEDIEWAKHWMERGYTVVYEPEAAVYHTHEETWPQVRRRYYREGQAAKWIGISNRRKVPLEVWNETRFLAADVVSAAKSRLLRKKGPEIVRFRYEKLLGRVAGIWDGARMENPLFREKMLFEKPYKAVVVQSPGQASMQTLELPPLKPGEILIRVAYEGVCATDIEVMEGTLGYYRSGVAKYPIVPGHEFSGAVAATGVRVEGFSEGDRVVVECIQSCGQCEACKRGNTIGCSSRREVGVIGQNGGYAEYVITPARFAHRIPADVGLKEAALCEPLAVVLKGIRRLEGSSRPKTSVRCAVVGAGPIGRLSALVLVQRGYDVTIFDRNPDRLASLASQGIATGQDLNDLSRYEIVVEATGDPDALDTILQKTPAGATIVLLGLPYAKRSFNFETIVGYDKTIVGSVGSTAEDFDEALKIISTLDLTPFLGKVMPFDEFSGAWLAARSGKYLKVILKTDPRAED